MFTVYTFPQLDDIMHFQLGWGEEGKSWHFMQTVKCSFTRLITFQNLSNNQVGSEEQFLILTVKLPG